MKYLFLLVGLISFTAFGQDAKATALLDKATKHMKTQKSFYIEFSANIKNKASGTNESETGKGWVKGDKYYASYGENTIISNGMKTWTIIKTEKAVYETDASDEDEDAINPKKLMTIWENGFKNRYGAEETINGTPCHKIYLYPKKPSTVDYHTVVLYISKSNSEMKRVITRGKDGTKMTYNLTKFESNPSISDSKFVYDAKKYPGYTLIED